MEILNRFLARALHLLPRALVERVARRYIVGISAAEALLAVRQLHADGLLATVDLLGENAATEEEAAAVTREYLDLLDSLQTLGAGAYVSVKLTHLGLRIDEELACSNLTSLARKAAELDSFVRIDMEDSTTTDAALAIFRRVRAECEAVGIAIQAYLHRSLDDVRSLLRLRPNLRICKGIYRESRAIAWHDFRRVQESFLTLVRTVLEGGGYAAVATHDPYLVDGALRLLEGDGGSRGEFQMLCGVGHKLRPRILSAGYRLRLYCPYGPDWYEYSLRRLQENPALLRHVLKQFWPRGK